MSRTLFFENRSTLLPVDILPSAGRNYAIEVQNSADGAAIGQKWANYADGFEVGGAFFRYGCYGEESDRKIHRGDSVSPGKQYYLVTEQPYSSPYPEIQANQIGFIPLQNRHLTVSRVTINVSIKDAARYSLVNSYLKSRFGVWLLETAASVDRKYVGREIFFRRGSQAPHKFSYTIRLKDGSG